MTADQWDAGEPVDNDLLILVNAGGDGDEFTLPSGEYAMSWEIALDTSDATGKAGLTLRPAQSLIMEANSVAVLIGQRE
jgi:pullulanase/glycogen debranching enzyme